MIKIKYILPSVLLLSCLGIAGCSDDLLIEEKGGTQFGDIKPTKLRATIYFKDYELQEPATRFTNDTTDHWSIGGANVTFTDSDTVGIFARWGNMNLPTKDGRGGPLINVPMYFVKQEYFKDENDPSQGSTIAYTLENDTVEVYPPGMKTGNGVFMYYPYTPDFGNITNYPFWKDYVDNQTYQTGSIYWGSGYTNTNNVYPEIPGLELRVKGPDGNPRCRDVVQMFYASSGDLSKGIISGAVYHAFSEIIVTRGVGFDKPVKKLDNGETVEDETIYVVLDRPITHLQPVSYVHDWVRWTTKLIYQPGYTFDGKEMDEDEAKKWYAWEGAKYPYTAKMDQSLRKRAWYVIVPSVFYQNTSATNNLQYTSQYSTRPIVSEICLYDNDGILQHVTSFTLKTSDGASPTKAPYPYYRWPIEIAMDELGPIVRPVTIENWDEDRPDKDITDVRTAGIHNMEEFTQWASAYNTFIANNRRDNSALSQYGDLIDGVWHFYFSNFDFEGISIPVIDDLQDIMEGENQFFNVVWSNLNLATPICTKISGNGGFRNIDFENVSLNYTADENPVGIFAKNINTDYGTGGNQQTFENCNVNGSVVSKGAVGLVSGTINFGRFTNCEFIGRLKGSRTSQTPAKLFGEDPAQQMNFDNTSFTNIMFTPQQ